MDERIPDTEKLREDLNQVLGETPEPSAELRAAVMDHGARRRRRAPAQRWRVPAAVATMAAAAALVLLVTRPEAPAPVLQTQPMADAVSPMAEEMVMGAPAAEAPAQKLMMRAAPVEGDLNGDGRVNIVDAWRLSQSIKTGQGQGELDADGEVSPDDLDRLMRQIVAVRGGAS